MDVPKFSSYREPKRETKINSDKSHKNLARATSKFLQNKHLINYTLSHSTVSFELLCRFLIYFLKILCDKPNSQSRLNLELGICACRQFQEYYHESFPMQIKPNCFVF